MPQAGVDPDAPNAPGGQDLFDYVDLHPDGLPISAIRRVFAQIADALFFLHDHGIVHRDIKDENVVLDHQGNVQVIDFGSAAYVKEGKKFDTFSGTLECVLSSLLHRSVELMRFEQLRSARSLARSEVRRQGDGYLGAWSPRLRNHLRYVLPLSHYAPLNESSAR